MHLKVGTYIRCFIDMSLYNNFNYETQADVPWKKIWIMLETKSALNRVFIFRKIVRPRYQDGLSMVDNSKTQYTQS